MRRHSRHGRGTAPVPATPAPRPPRHPVAMALGLLLVAGVAGVTAFAAWSLYSDYAWHANARSAAADVALAAQSFSERDSSTPMPVDAVDAGPNGDQVLITDLPYAEDVPPDVTRIRISSDGALSVLTASEALCAGVTLNMSTPGKSPSGSFVCGEALAPPAPATLTAEPRDRAVTLDWPQPPAPVEDYVISYSSNGGERWSVFDDGVSSNTRSGVSPLVNGHEYLFRVTAANLVGESPPVTASASPFAEPGPPRNVRAAGGFRAILTWDPPLLDGGRPVTGYVVSGDPAGGCSVPATSTRCEISDLPAASGYTFMVRAVNEAGAGEPNTPATAPISVYSAPGRPVALSAAPGDRLALLTWTDPLQDGNTPITDYRVEYRAVGQEQWTEFAHPASPATTAVVPGLLNGVEYEFRVMAVNVVGISDPPLSTAFQTPATVPGAVPKPAGVAGDSIVRVTWTPPAVDGAAAITDYTVQYRPPGGSWLEFSQPAEAGLARDFTSLTNGTRYAFRVAAVNRMGTGPWSPRVLATPVGPPGPVAKPESEGSRKDIELTWEAPLEDGGLPIRAYRVDYRLSEDPDWTRVARIPSTETTYTVDGLESGESYDFRIVAINKAGAGPPTADLPIRPNRPTLAAVIADQTPPAPVGLTAVPGDRMVTLTWQESPAGRKSPITAYTVTGTPKGTCTTKGLTCVIRGLANGTSYSFTVSAANANIVGPESDPVAATPKVFNEAAGGTVTTYTRNGRTYRVHTFTAGSTFTVTSAGAPFTVLVVGGGGGSTAAGGGTVAVGGGGGVINARRATLPVGPLDVTVGAGGPPGAPGGASALAAVGTAPGGAAGSPTNAEFSPTTRSGVSGRPITYGGEGSPASGPGTDGRGVGGGGPSAARGGNGVVIVRYEVAR